MNVRKGRLRVSSQLAYTDVVIACACSLCVWMAVVREVLCKRFICWHRATTVIGWVASWTRATSVSPFFFSSRELSRSFSRRTSSWVMCVMQTHNGFWTPFACNFFVVHVVLDSLLCACVGCRVTAIELHATRQKLVKRAFLYFVQERSRRCAGLPTTLVALGCPTHAPTDQANLCMTTCPYTLPIIPIALQVNYTVRPVFDFIPQTSSLSRCCEPTLYAWEQLATDIPGGLRSESFSALWQNPGAEKQRTSTPRRRDAVASLQRSLLALVLRVKCCAPIGSRETAGEQAVT